MNDDIRRAAIRMKTWKAKASPTYAPQIVGEVQQNTEGLIAEFVSETHRDAVIHLRDAALSEELSRSDRTKRAAELAHKIRTALGLSETIGSYGEQFSLNVEECIRDLLVKELFRSDAGIEEVARGIAHDLIGPMSRLAEEGNKEPSWGHFEHKMYEEYILPHLQRLQPGKDFAKARAALEDAP